MALPLNQPHWLCLSSCFLEADHGYKKAWTHSNLVQLLLSKTYCCYLFDTHSHGGWHIVGTLWMWIPFLSLFLLSLVDSCLHFPQWLFLISMQLMPHMFSWPHSSVIHLSACIPNEIETMQCGFSIYPLFIFAHPSRPPLISQEYWMLLPQKNIIFPSVHG